MTRYSDERLLFTYHSILCVWPNAKWVLFSCGGGGLIPHTKCTHSESTVKVH